MTSAALSFSSLPDRAAEAAVRAALESFESVLVLIEEGGRLPLALLQTAWEDVRAKYLPADRVFIGACDEGATRLTLEPRHFCRLCDAQVTFRSCPHGEGARLSISESQVFETVRGGGNLPRELYRPEVTERLRVFLETSKPEERASQRLVKEGGFILWFTGLSGAGKSTLSKAVVDALPDLKFALLDGDEVRTYLSKGLGFSKEDRDTNVRRIGFVARLLARHGTPVITAAISPYREVREEIRALAEREGIDFVEVFASASLEALVERDVKGLYRKALAGELAHFTGVSDPYEPPESPDVLVRTDAELLSVSVERILAYLRERGLVR